MGKRGVRQTVPGLSVTVSRLTTMADEGRRPLERLTRT